MSSLIPYLDSCSPSKRRTSSAGMTTCLIKDVCCHPGLDPGSSFKITPRIKIEVVSLDSRFRGNDKKTVPFCLSAFLEKPLIQFFYYDPLHHESSSRKTFSNQQ